ncbi:LacI family DNA-binding transcriptional regulator [Actinocorallia lasiicapitis]
MAVTIAEVARAAEVSTGTVSNSLNGTGRVSEATRRRVRDVAERLGYGVTRTGILALGVTTFELAWNYSALPYYARTIAAATSAAHRHGYGLTVLPSALSGDGWRALAIDGALILDSPLHDRAVPILRRRGIPIAFDGHPASLGRHDSWFDNDHAATTRQVVAHLREQGAERIGLLAGPGTDHFTRTCVDTYRALVADPLVAWASTDDLTGRTAADLLLRAGADAVFGLYDGCGLAVLDAARALNLRVPADLLIVTCSEDPAYATTTPPITTVSLSPETIADAVAALAATLTGSPATTNPTLPTHLTLRPSSLRTPPPDRPNLRHAALSPSLKQATRRSSPRS